MWLVCKTRAKILLSDPETWLTTPRFLPLRRSRRSYGNYQSPQSSGSSRNILKRLGRSGRSYGNQAYVTKKPLRRSRIRTCTRADKPRHEQGTLKFNSWMGCETLYSFSLSHNWSTEFKYFFLITLWKARKPWEAKSEATVCPALFDETLCRRLKWKIFFSG